MRRASTLVSVSAVSATAAMPLLLAIACGTPAATQYGESGTDTGTNTETSNNGGSSSSSSGPSDTGNDTSISTGTGTTSTVVTVTGTFTETATVTTTSGTATSVITATQTMTATQSVSGTGTGTAQASGDGGPSPDGGAEAGSVRACAVASTSVIADFEDDKKAGVAANGFPGIWSANAGATTAQTATSVLGASTDTLTPPTCNKWALHATASGITYTDPTGSEYAQEFAPLASKSATAFPTTDLSAYDGISFDIKLGSGTTGTGSPLAFELLTAVSQPPGAPPTGDFGTATTAGVDQYNNRSWMLWNNTTPLSTTWQRIYVPFHVMVPHWLPSGCKGSPCGAPALSAKAAMAVQWAVNPSQGPSASFTGSYDVWIDNVTAYTGSDGLLPPGGFSGPTSWNNGSTKWNCSLPTFADGAKADGKYLLWAYNNWKTRFVTPQTGSPQRVQRPENNNDSVSEGIGYGMLIAVYMNDQSLFNGLWAYWKSQLATTYLMTWDVPGGSGSASDADQDAAFALLAAYSKGWSGVTLADVTGMLGDVWKSDIDSGTLLPNRGSNGGAITNPSYFAPAYYPYFAKVDTGHNWAGVTTAVYAALNRLAAAVSPTDGLVPAWCTPLSGSTPCNAAATNMASTDVDYQYDAHRVPWRVGLDYCWNSSAAAKSFLQKMIAYFDAQSSSGAALGLLADQYTLNSGPLTPSAPNSMSLIGSAGVGAMAVGNTAFANAAWQFALDGSNRALLDVAVAGSQSGYSYYNATVGLLTLLSFTGNFYPLN